MCLGNLQIYQIHRWSSGPSRILGFLKSCDGITSIHDLCLLLLLLIFYLALLLLDGSLFLSFHFPQFLKAQYLFSYTHLKICACTNLVYIFGVLILNNILQAQQLQAKSAVITCKHDLQVFFCSMSLVQCNSLNKRVMRTPGTVLQKRKLALLQS